VLYARKPVPAGGTGHGDAAADHGNATARRGAGRLEGAHAGA
jgi:hypothetical protein